MTRRATRPWTPLIGGLLAMRDGFVRPYTDAVCQRFFERRLEIDLPEAIAGVVAEWGVARRLGLLEERLRDAGLSR